MRRLIYNNLCLQGVWNRFEVKYRSCNLVAQYVIKHSISLKKELDFLKNPSNLSSAPESALLILLDPDFEIDAKFHWFIKKRLFLLFQNVIVSVTLLFCVLQDKLKCLPLK